MGAMIFAFAGGRLAFNAKNYWRYRPCLMIRWLC